MTVTTSPQGAAPGAAAADPYAAAPGAATPAAGAGAPGRPAPAGRSRLARRLSDTPGRLALATVVAVVASIGLGALGFVAGIGQSGALDDVRTDAAQLVGTQELRNDLVSADATATNAFLVGGLEPAEARARYEDAMTSAAQAVPRLAAGAPEDTGLQSVSGAIQEYAGLVESARANNRQGFPVGAAYLDQASATLRSGTLPTLDEVAGQTAQRVEDGQSSVAFTQALLALVWLGLVGLVGVQVWLARRTHRVLNVRLVLGTAVALVGAVVVTAAVVGGNGVARGVNDGPYGAVVTSSQALAQATDAKSMESFTLIKRGSGQAYENRFVACTDTSALTPEQLADEAFAEALAVCPLSAAEILDQATADGQLAGSSSTLLGQWVAEHQEIRALDDGGEWEDAVAAATASGEGTAAAAFDAFAEQVRDDITASGQEVDQRLGSASGTSATAAWVALLAGLIAAVLAASGLNVRMKEYR
ncbi:hypothetical protein [Antribacter gilvus]|uniref:hypothetical protein n=1 Tax=Antribacter gilvus TaxID=2304675 RepID=UPI000F76A9F8|nr:hypothetical protein [Antribacter gilvus]